MQLGQLFGALAQRDRPLLGHLRVDQAPAQRGRGQGLVDAGKGAVGLGQDPGRAAHRLDPGRDDERGVAGLDGAAALDSCLEARAAQAVDGGTGHARGQAGEQGGHAGDVAVLLAGAVGVAHEDVVDGGGVERGRAVQQRAHDMGGEVVGAHARQAAAVAAERGAHGVEDVRGRVHTANTTPGLERQSGAGFVRALGREGLQYAPANACAEYARPERTRWPFSTPRPGPDPSSQAAGVRPPAATSR